MNPTTIHFDHRRSLVDGFKKDPIWALLNLQVTSLAQLEAISDWLGKDDSASFVDFDIHTIYIGIYHLKW